MVISDYQGVAWECNKCGACCRHVGRWEKARALGLVAEDEMQCKHLTDDNLCAIYEDRPDVCRVDFSWGAMMPHTPEVMNAWCELNRSFDQERNR